MRIIISGGGTGGHIYPAITLIRAIQEKIRRWNSFTWAHGAGWKRTS